MSGSIKYRLSKSAPLELLESTISLSGDIPGLIQASHLLSLAFPVHAVALVLRDAGRTDFFPLPVRWRSSRQYEFDVAESDRFRLVLEGPASDSFALLAQQEAVSAAYWKRIDEDIWYLCVALRVKRGTSVERCVLACFLVDGRASARRAIADGIQNSLTEVDVGRFRDAVAIYVTAFDQLLTDLCFMPREMVARSWRTVLQGSQLSWDKPGGSETPTLTLSLDIRRSTFAMQQACDRLFHAAWLDAVAQLARELTLLHGGIFDKFTGDGALVHFVYEAGDKASEEAALRSAMGCASEILLAMREHSRHLECNLKFLSELFGPAIGMARDISAWSLDRDGRPIVVGTGVVNACRLSGGEAGWVVITNDLRAALERLSEDWRFEKHLLRPAHKDFPPEQQASCWAIKWPALPAARSASDTSAIVHRIWSEVLARRSIGYAANCEGAGGPKQ